MKLWRLLLHETNHAFYCTNVSASFSLLDCFKRAIEIFLNSAKLNIFIESLKQIKLQTDKSAFVFNVAHGWKAKKTWKSNFNHDEEHI
ncbi:hypothetical protein HZS_3404 [Henneguya salminicola]|nr:hypothetical protein HZS_3404 [Henneguya salminicola]